MQILLIGIGGVYNYGCEAIVRGTEAILHSEWPQAKIVYASYRPEDDRARLNDCPMEIVSRTTLRRYSAKNITRKVLSLAGLDWCPVRDNPVLARGSDAVLSIGGDIYTLDADGHFGASLPKLGDLLEKRGTPYVLWGASVGPFSANPKAEQFFSRHLRRISLITAREAATADYLRTLGVVDNVVSCADPAYCVAPEIQAIRAPDSDEPMIGVNLSPLAAKYGNLSQQSALSSQAAVLEGLIANCGARIMLIPHVVCDFMEIDDDLRYLERLRQAIALRYRDRVTVVHGDRGFVGTKHELIKCHLVIAARMH
ncbi:MAG TPA: polysaccharide pyruvyl transferase family protein, partial [Planctomycetaceae bacterium]|nr:polysaccharide pyruvyl transferase family protein [Planctomycetaceae bacterium]